MKFFEVLREIKNYFIFRKRIREIEKKQRWKDYNFSKGWFSQFGTIVKVRREDIIGMDGTTDPILVKLTVVEFLKPFFENLNDANLSEIITPKVKRLEYTNKYDYFYQVTFWFIFNHFTYKYVITRLFLLSVLIYIINQKSLIFQFLNGISIF